MINMKHQLLAAAAFFSAAAQNPAAPTGVSQMRFITAPKFWDGMFSSGHGRGHGKQPHRPSGIAKARRAARKRRYARRYNA